MRTQLFVAVRLMVVATVIALGYSLLSVLGAGLFFRDQSSGSLIVRDGQVIGSRRIGQPFGQPKYFHPRPSAGRYDGRASSAANLGPANPDLLETMQGRVDSYRSENGVDPATAVPVDAVTTSASGLDPHISIANARLQAARVARARNVPLDEVMGLIEKHTSVPAIGLGSPGVNVLELNVSLDERGRA